MEAVLNGLTLLASDMAIDQMPGRADGYGILPLTRSPTCQLFFVSDAEGVILSGRRLGGARTPYIVPPALRDWTVHAPRAPPVPPFLTPKPSARAGYPARQPLQLPARSGRFTTDPYN